MITWLLIVAVLWAIFGAVALVVWLILNDRLDAAVLLGLVVGTAIYFH